MRLKQVQSPIIPIVGDLITSNPGTISLGQGVVYYDPPPQIQQGLIRFAESSGNHRYQEVEGLAELRQVIAQKVESDNNINAENFEVVVTAGSNMGFLNAVLAITDPGDEIILTSPCYFNHEMAVQIAGCNAVLVQTEEDYLPNIESLEAAITPRTRAIVSISPNNPTGVVYPQKLLVSINKLCEIKDIFHISDEAYEYFIYDGKTHFSPASQEDSQQHTISLFSLSKSFSMASWRIGYMLIPKQLMSAVKKIQDTNLICPVVISQYAAIEALKIGSSYISDEVKALERVRATLLEGISQLDNVKLSRPGGAFYAFLELPECSLDDMAITRQLIEEYGVAVIPGSAFKMQDSCYIRVSYGALHPSQSKKGIQRLLEGLNLIA